MVVVLLSLASCKGKGNLPDYPEVETENLLLYASRIKIREHPSGWKEVNIINPWDTTKNLQNLALIDQDSELPADEIPENFTIVRVPLKRSLVTSTVHVGLIEEFGAVNAIAGVTDIDFLKSTKIKIAINNGKVSDCGRWLSPDIEKIIELSPDAILLSPYQHGGSYGNITELGIPIIYVADYMEKDPLARAEWIKFYGMLYGKETLTDRIFLKVKNCYDSIGRLCQRESSRKGKKKILMDIPYSGSWQIPTGGSINDYFVKASGAINPFSYIEGEQFGKISTEKVLYEAQDADIWIIRHNSPYKLSLVQLKKDFSYAPQFEAYRKGKVWGCNTGESLYFEETPFHPERILEDLYNISYNENSPDSLNYFIRLH